MKNLILCGFMGSGKTTLGKMLAEKFGLQFLDTDEYIEKKLGLKISEIFSKFGEEYFRNLETETIKTLTDRENMVISLGGGIAAKESNHKYLKDAGVVIFLDTGEEEMLRRVFNDKTRPLTLKGEDELVRLYRKRKPIYLKVADITVDSSKTADESYLNLVRCLEKQQKTVAKTE